MKEYSSYSAFQKDILKYLGKYNKNVYKSSKPGIYKYRGTEYKYYHILSLEGTTKPKAIKAIVNKDCVNFDMFKSPHRYAHHLNSSQVVCYEFFRPLLNDDKKKLLDLFSEKLDININNTPTLSAKFEFVTDKQENTNFDLFVGKEATKIYFEIKYTENGFGSCENDKEHLEKFNEIYKPYIENCGCLKKKPQFDEFRKYYQLFRNVLRVTNENGSNEYSVFIFPKANKATVKQFNEFKQQYISDEMSSHVLCLYWEELVDYMSEKFRNKFFFYV